MTEPRRRPSMPTSAALRRGLSLVELMVGVVIGLFIVAAAATLVTGQLGENRALLIETQMQQDLRAASDIMARELRRIGAWDNAFEGVATPGIPARGNALTAVVPAASGVPSSELSFYYHRRFGEDGAWGFKLDSGVIKSMVRASLAWQDLTDASVMRVTEFSITGTSAPDQEIACPKLCPDGTTACWPKLAVRDFEIFIKAEARTDPRIVRTVRSLVRARNDAVAFAAPGTPFQACPT